MRSLPTALQTYLQGNAFLCADLYEFDVGGTTYRLTNSDRNLTGVSPAAASTYTAANIDRERIRSSDGLEVDDLDISIQYAAGDGLGSESWSAIALRGGFDEAPVRVYRAYLNPSTFAIVGCYLRFAGVTTTVEPGSTTMRLVVSVGASQFSRKFPAVSYEKLCVWNLGGPGCDYASTLTHTVTIGSESTRDILQIASLPGGVSGPEKFFQGTVTVGYQTRTIIDTGTAGESAGVGHELTTGYGFRLSPAMPAALVSGASATMRLGCGKTSAICDSWFSNLSHHMAAPLAPANA